MELSEKIETALVGHLQSLTWPVYFDPAMILPGESEQAITSQTILCICDDASDEDPPHTGNFWYPVRVELRTPSARPTEEELATLNFLTNLEKHQALAAILEAGLALENLPELLTDQLETFHCFAVLDRTPLRAQTESFWMSGRSLRLYACSASMA